MKADHSIHADSSGSKQFNQFLVGGKKIVTRQHGGTRPFKSLKFEVLEWGGIFNSRPKEDQKKFFREFFVAVPRAVDLGAYGGRDAKFFAQFARQSFRRGFALFHFAARKLPLQCVRVATLSLADQKLRIPGDQRCDDSSHEE